MASANFEQPRVDRRQRAPIDLQVVPPRPQALPPREQGQRDHANALDTIAGACQDRVCRHGRHGVTELAAGLDQIVHPGEVLEDGGWGDRGATGNIPKTRADNSLLIVQVQRRLDDSATCRCGSIGAFAETIAPRHFFTEHIVR